MSDIAAGEGVQIRTTGVPGVAEKLAKERKNGKKIVKKQSGKSEMESCHFIVTLLFFVLKPL